MFKPEGLPEKQQSNNIEQREGNIALELNWEDLKYIEDNNLGLRHVSRQDAMDRSLEQGVQGGDSLAIKSVSKLVPQELIPGFIQKASELYRTIPDIATLDKHLTQDGKQKIIDLFHTAVVSFIDSSLDFDAMADQGCTKEAYIQSFKGRHSFLLLRTNHEGGYDEDVYYGLGKSGKQYLSPKDCLGGISADKIIESLGISIKESGEIADRQFEKRIAEVVYQLFVSQIQSIRVSDQKA